MTLYAGETTRVRSTANDLNDNPLTVDNVLAANVTIVRTSDSTVMVNAAAMTWDTDNFFWYYDWQTTLNDSGAFRAKVEFTGNNFQTWEYATIRLKANPA